MILTADIGTSSLKAALIDFDGRLLAFCRAAYKCGENKTVLAEDWENAFFDAVNAIRSDLKIMGKEETFNPEAICISGNGPTLAPLDFEDKAFPPLFWYDGKCLQPKEGSPSFFLPRAAWFKENRPEDYGRVKRFLSPHDFLAFRLGAEPVTSIPSSAYKSYYWDGGQCALYGIEGEKFPPLLEMGEPAGKLSCKAAARLNIKQGIPIVSGAPDFIAALIGSGAIENGKVCDRAGTSEGINLCVSSLPEKGVFSPDFRALPHAKKELWNLGIVIPESGRLFEKYLEISGGRGRDYGALLKELIPDANSARLYESSKSAFPLQAQSFSSRVEFGRAVLETMAFSVRAAIEKFSIKGFAIKEMTVSGGQGKNPLWNRLKSDITGTSLLIPEIPDAELAGNAALAAKALKKVSSLEEGVSKIIRIKESFSPDKANAAFWEERFRLYGEKKKSLFDQRKNAESGSEK